MRMVIDLSDVIGERTVQVLPEKELIHITHTFTWVIDNTSIFSDYGVLLSRCV